MHLYRTCRGFVRLSFSGGLVLSVLTLFLLPVSFSLSKKGFSAGPEEAVDGPVPAPLISLGGSGEVLLVEKGTQSLYIFDHNYRLIKTYRVTTGKRKGAKQREGDLKTPEGVYLFTKVIDPAGLPPKYGVMALSTDYPNPLDRLMKRGGSGIWLHGTDDPGRINRPRDSRGCVVATNGDMLKIAGHIRLMSTPMVIVERLTYLPQNTIEKEKREIMDFLKRWIKTTVADGGATDHDAGFRIDTEDAKILRQGGSVVVLLKEDRRDKRGRWVSGTGRLYLTKGARGWHVAARRWHPEERRSVPAMAGAAETPVSALKE